jgi:hypothetical protein
VGGGGSSSNHHHRRRALLATISHHDDGGGGGRKITTPQWSHTTQQHQDIARTRFSTLSSIAHTKTLGAQHCRGFAATGG